MTTINKLDIETIETQDPILADMMIKELNRQQSKIELIASENFTSKAVMEAQGTWLTNKYAEGQPNKRYYGGCEYVDQIETLAIERAKELFGAEHANVQPHSGASANIAVFFALLTPGDTILGMNLSHGGHLTHGSPVNISGKYFNVIPYGVRKEDERLDYDSIRDLALKNKPKMIIAGASAYPRQIDFERIGKIAKEVNALYMVDMAHIAGLVAAGVHPTPVPYADVVTSTTHKTLRGPRGGIILCKEKHAKALNKAVFPGTQGGPLMHVIAAKAVAFKEALKPEFKTYQQQVIKNAQKMGEQFEELGLRVVSGGSENHLNLLDVRSLNMTGKQGEELLDSIGITTNKNTIPFDPESPFVTSGIRIGTPAVTSRGMKEPEMIEIANLIVHTLRNVNNPETLEEIKKQVVQLTDRFPLY